MGEQNLNDIASRWVVGEPVEWESLYTSDKPRRVSLPNYPFAQERFWISDSPIPKRRASLNIPLHPLISSNSSTLNEVSFSSSLSNIAFYAVDHKVNKEKILPGAAFLEMACISGNIAGEQRVRKIKDIVWIQPLSFRKGPQMLRISLKRAGESVEYVVSSLDEEHETILHSEGRLVFGNSAADPDDAGERVAIQALKSRCARFLGGTAYYDKFRQYGFEYGPAFQTIQEIYIDDSIALSRLKIADHLQLDFDQYILHPSIIDGALQTAAGLVGGLQSAVPHVPFALDEVEIIHPVSQICYACAEPVGVHGQSFTDIRKFNIQLLNESGEVLIKFKNLFVRALVSAQASVHSLVEV
jgi:acyl transferase domain-containing protein